MATWCCVLARQVSDCKHEEPRLRNCSLPGLRCAILRVGDSGREFDDVRFTEIRIVE